tara:strand:+ start:1790 stop:2299 length:510 start_codon:yes stop_codon:yes gene_type:complete
MSKKKSEVAKRNIRILRDLEEAKMTHKEVASKYNLSVASIKAIKAKHKSSAGGLGTTIKNVLESKPLAKVAEAVKSALWRDGEDCGCEERQAKLDAVFPTRRSINCMTEEMYDSFGRIKDMKSLGSSERAEVAKMHAHVFKHKIVVPCTCTPKRWSGFVSDLTKVYESY